MALGVLNNEARIEEYDPQWEIMAKQLIEELENVLSGYAVDIQHVGSTSIKGIYAKPIIDIVVAVEDVEAAVKYIDVLEKINIQYEGEVVAGQRMFKKSTPGVDDHTHHIHFVKYNSYEWQDYINMRDYCNAKPEVAEAYANLKKELIQKYSHDRVGYTKSKGPFIEKTLAEARIWREQNQV